MTTKDMWGEFSVCPMAFVPHMQWKKIALILITLLLLARGAHAQAPTVSGLNPYSGGAGQSLNVNGSNFGSSQGTSFVTFNGTQATTIQAWSSTRITLVIPTGATTGPVVVNVGGVASNGVTFTVITTPYISDVSPNTGGAGLYMNVNGANFGSSQGTSFVTFNGTQATHISVWGNNRVTLYLPSGVTIGAGPVVVNVGGVASNSVTFTEITTPYISSLAGSSGGIGSTFTVSGSGFGATQGTSTLTINGTPVTQYSYWNANQIGAAIVPTGANSGYVVVTVNGASSPTNQYLYFTVTQAPAITSANNAAFTVGTPGSFTVTATGSPSPTLSETGTLPPSVTFNATTGLLAGTPASGTTGSYPITFKAHNGAGSDATQNFTLTVQLPQPPAISNLSSSSGAAGLHVVITGSSFLTATSVTLGTSSASYAINSDSQITVTIPSGASSGNIAVTNLGGTSNQVPFTVVAPPAISASAFPAANASGWTNMNATVTFTCTPGGLAIASCPVSRTVSTEGVGQVVSGTVTDTAGDVATASITINLDKTVPSLSVTSPVDGASFSNSTATVSGTLTDALSGTSGVTCDGVTATLSGGSFSCNISLNVGVNLVVVRGTDIASNVAGANFHVSLTGSLSAPTSLQVAPTGVNMLVGDTQQFTVVDEQGRPRTDASWGVDNTTVGTIDTNSSPTLTAVSAGQVTLTATVGSVTAQTQVQVLSGTSLPMGTIRWSAPSAAGYSVSQTLQAVPTSSGPDLYSIETNQNDGSALVRALTADGRQMWVTQFPNGLVGSSYGWGVPDGYGGILLYNGQDLDAQTGAQVWQHDVVSPLAIGNDGKIYFHMGIVQGGSNFNSFFALDGLSGAPMSSYVPSNNTITPDTSPSCFMGGPSTRTFGPAEISNPTVGTNGSAYALVLTKNIVTQCVQGTSTQHSSSVDYKVSLLQMTPDGSTTLTPIHDDTTLISSSVSLYDLYSWGLSETNYGTPLLTIRTDGELPRIDVGGMQVIPDGQDGLLLSWFDSNESIFTTSYRDVHVAHLNGGQTEYTLAFAAAGMVLGENGVAYGSGSTRDGQHKILAFNIPDGSPLWTYTSPSTSDYLGIVAASAGGGLKVMDANYPNQTQTLLSLDATGAASGPNPVSTFENPQYSRTGELFATPGYASVASIESPLELFAPNFWETSEGDPSGNGAAGASCACAFETDESAGNPPPPPQACPICNLPAPTTMPTCITWSGNQSTFLILVGDPGLNNPGGNSYNVGNLFALSAQTQANNLQAQGHHVIACRVSSIDLVYSALTQQGFIDGGVIYFGHSGVRQQLDSNGVIVVQTSNIFVGETSAQGTNINASNVNELSGVQTANAGTNNLGPNAAFTIYGCNAGETIFYKDISYVGKISIAQLISNNLKRGVYAYEFGMYFSQMDAQHDPYRSGGRRSAPNSLPMYMVSEGVPGHKPNAISFTPR